MTTNKKFSACSFCFNDRGLQLDAEQIGISDAVACPNCGKKSGFKLTKNDLQILAYRYFVWGSLIRFKYGAAPLIQFNQYQKTSINVSSWLKSDLELVGNLLGVGFFHYGPRFWMFGEIDPLKALQRKKYRHSILKRIISEYPTHKYVPGDLFYRIRKSPNKPNVDYEYDSPPVHIKGSGRLDSKSMPVLYASPDLQVCIHECRVTVEDELYVATLNPQKDLNLLDLSVVLKEDDRITEFESLDMAVHMLFLAGKHSYKITREIAASARLAGFDGIIYPSYFSLIRKGEMPFQTVYGISNRRIPQLQNREYAKSVPNLAIFGRPIKEKKIKIICIDKLILNQVVYNFHFGPACVEEI
jgi:hypothetical protein